MDRSSGHGRESRLSRVDTGDLVDRWGTTTTFGPEGTPVRCGVSGGADSLALMALAVAMGYAVTAVHVDHGQRPNSHGEAERVAAYANEVGASFESAHVVVSPGANLEARMRAARYELLGLDCATGHTMDDQAETVLINLMRGSGVRGLGAMQPGHRRPILSLRRSDTEAICAAMAWEPFMDPTNTDPSFVRNRVRRELVPLLSAIAGRDVIPLLARTADHARSTVGVVESVARELDASDAIALAGAPDAVAACALQRWMQDQTDEEHPIDTKSVERVLGVARGEAIAAEVAGGYRVSRSKQRLRVEPIT